MKKARNILLVITILGYALFIQIAINGDNNLLMQSKRNGVNGMVNRNNVGSNQTSEINLATKYVELNKGMDPTPIPKFPPQIVIGKRPEKWNEEQDGIYRTD